MDEQVDKKEWNPQIITKEGKEYLGIPIGTKNAKYFFGKLSSLKKIPGWLVQDNQITEWYIEGLHQTAENTYFYGPAVKGSLWDELPETQPDNWLAILLKLATAMERLKAQQDLSWKIYPLGVLLADNGGVLFLPPAIIEEIVIVSPPPVQLRQKMILSHPDLKGDAGFSYSLGVCSYRFIAGKFPYELASEDDIFFRIRNYKLVPLHLSVPGTDKAVSDFIMAVLGQDSSFKPDCSEWITSLTQWQSQGITRSITEAEKQDLLQKALIRQQTREKVFKAGVFLFRQKWKITIIAAVVITLGIIGSTSVYNLYLRPRVTKGQTPAEIVRTYYESISAIDYFTLEDCMVRGAFKDDLNEVINLYVLTRQQAAYSNETNIIPAETWTDQGRPLLAPGKFVFGVCNLEIRAIQNDTEPVFQARYEKWYSEYDDSDPTIEGRVVYLGFTVTDNLYLKMDRGGWVIYQLDRVEKEPIEYEPEAAEL